MEYRSARSLLLERATHVVFLNYPARIQMYQVINRTIHRSLRGTVLRNGNIESPLRTVFTNRQHILRRAWSTRNKLQSFINSHQQMFEHVEVLVFTHPSQFRHSLKLQSQHE